MEDLSNIIIVCWVFEAISGAAWDHLSEILLQVFIVYIFAWVRLKVKYAVLKF